MSDDAATSARMTRGQIFTLVATGLGLFMLFLDAMVVNVALPDIQKDLGGGEAALQWIVAVYSLAMAVLIMSSASVADRFGRRRLYLGAVAVFALASLACGLATSSTFLIIARAVQGAAASASNVASLALVSAAFPDPKAKGRAIGWWTAIAGLGIALGPTVGGVFSDIWGWRSVFFANLPIGALTIVLTVMFVKESRDEGARGLDWPGQGLFVIGFGALSYGLIEAPHNGWLAPRTLTLFVIGIVAIVGLVLYELAARHPMMDIRLLREPPYAAAILIVFIALFGCYGMLLVFTQYLQNVRGYSALAAGGFLFAFSVPGPFVSAYEGRLVEKVGPRLPSLAGVGFEAIGLAMVALSIGRSVPGMLGGLFLMGVGLGMCIPATTAVAMGAVPAERAGMASGMLSAQRGLGSTAGFAVMGSIVAAWLTAFLPGALDKVVPDPAERTAAVAAIVSSTDPRANLGAIAPARPAPGTRTVSAGIITDAADDVFADGVRLSLAIAAVAAGGAFLVGLRLLPKTAPAELPAGAEAVA